MRQYKKTRRGISHAASGRGIFSAVTACMLAAMLMCVSVFPAFALTADAADAPDAQEAETEVWEADTTNISFLNCAFDAGALMVSGAIQENVSLPGREGLWDFRTIEYGSADLALLFFPSVEVQEQLAGLTGTTGTGIAAPLAAAINSQFSEAYAQAAQSLIAEGEYYDEMPEGISMAVVMLFFDMHISMTVITEDAWSSVFLMSDKTVLPTVDETYIPSRLASFGVDGEIEQVIYNDAGLDLIFEKEGYRGSVDSVFHAITASEETYLQMVPQMWEGSAYRYNSYITPERVNTAYANDHEQEYADPIEQIRAVRALAAQAAQGAEEQWPWTGISAGVSEEEYAGFSAQSRTADYQPDKTMLVILRNEGDETGKIDYSIESILPESNLPSSPEEADQIILVESHWLYDGMNNGIEVYDCKTLISLYDAETEEYLGVIGTSFNALSGFTMVSGNSYYPSVDKSDVKEEILRWISGTDE